MTMITFKDDKDRRNFQITIALEMLRTEVNRSSGMLVCDPRKGTTIGTLRRYWPWLKKTRKAAYKQLVEVGIYEHLDAKN